MKKTFQAKRWNRLWTRGGLAFFLGLLMLLAVALLSAGPDTPSELARFAGRSHPLLVHLPIGVFTLSFLFDVAGRFFEPENWLVQAAFYTQVVGLLSARSSPQLSLRIRRR